MTIILIALLDMVSTVAAEDHIVDMGPITERLSQPDIEQLCPGGYDGREGALQYYYDSSPWKPGYWAGEQWPFALNQFPVIGAKYNAYGSHYIQYIIGWCNASGSDYSAGMARWCNDGSCGPYIPPEASFDITPIKGTAPLNVTFTDTSQNTSDVTQFTWNFGNGQTLEGNWPNLVNSVNTTYAAAGNYTITYNLTYPRGISRATEAIQVTSAALAANFTGTPTSGSVPLTVRFTDTSTGSPTKWSWNFGDGTSSTLRNPMHIYSNHGTYSVSLTAANANVADTERKTDYVTVTPRGTFSITQVGHTFGNDLTLQANDTSHWVYKVLHDDNHWQNIFWKKESEVSKEDFGTQGGGLNSATFHFHVGHGGYDLLGSNTSLDIGNWQYLHASDVERKWGGNNKWVYLHSCDVLADPSWAKALDSTHGIFGFSTIVPDDLNVPASFFSYASSSSNPRTLVEAFNDATGPVFTSNTTAKVIFGTKKQYDTDHLPGFGDIAPDRASTNHSYFQRSWICWGTVGVKQ